MGNLLRLNKVIERGINGTETEVKFVSVLDGISKENLLQLAEIGAEL